MGNKSGKIRKSFFLILFLIAVLAAVISKSNIAASFLPFIVKDSVKITTAPFYGGDSVPAGELSRLYDSDTGTECVFTGTLGAETILLSNTVIDAVKVFGNPSVKMTVELYYDGGWHVPAGMSGIDLGKAGKSWNSYAVSGGRETEKIKFIFESYPAGAAAEISEIEIWGKGSRMNIADAASAEMAYKEDSTVSFAAVYKAEPDEKSVTVTRVKQNTTITDAVFTVSIPVTVSSVKRAWLSYELKGLPGWIGAEHSINGSGRVPCWPMSVNSSWAAQKEEIRPALLRTGDNEIRFTLPTGSAAGYSVRNLVLITETDNGHNFISDASPSDARKLLDGNPGTSFVLDEGNTACSFTLSGAVEPVSLDIAVSGASSGQLEIYGRAGDMTALLASVDASVFQEGWNNVPVTQGISCEEISVKLSGGRMSAGEIAVCGSGTAPALRKDIMITFPDSGQYYGRSAYITGFITVPSDKSGPAQVLAGPVPAVLKDGVFSAIVSKEDIGLESDADSAQWSVDVTLIYPDGTRIVKQVVLNNMDGSVSGTGKISAETEGTYGFGVKGGKKVKIKKHGIEIEMEGEDEDKSANLQIVPLGQADLPGLETGMINVTANYKAYRMMPHGAKFKKKIRLKIPFDRKKMPKGMKDDEVKTYYFNDKVNLWLPIERESIDSNEAAVVSLTDHFTDFINAVMVKPENPQMQSFNPNQIKDLPPASPVTGLQMIPPPSANSKGDNILYYKLDIPQGRLGMQPEIVITYNSSGSDSVLGYGWDMPLRAVTCETRWGVPRYDQYFETESYLLEGEQLVPQVHRNVYNTPRTSSDKRFYERVQKNFKRIVRKGSVPGNYHWEVVDKSGVKHIYGSTSGARFEKSGGTGIFMWLLEESQDLNGNAVKYTYSTSGGMPRLETARYTCNSNDSTHPDGYYLITFNYEPRLHKKIDYRAGFRKELNLRLKSVICGLNGVSTEPYYKKYIFGYAEGAFGKELLKKITQSGQTSPAGQDVPVSSHSFDYYQHPSGSEAFTKPYGEICDTGMTNALVGDEYDEGSPYGTVDSTLSWYNTNTRSYDTAATFSIGIPLIFSLSANGSMQKYFGNTKVRYTMADFDGDGLADIGYLLPNGQMKYRRNLGQGIFSENEGTLTLSGVVPMAFGNSKSEGNNTTQAFNWNLLFLSGTISAFGNSYSESMENAYITDANTDGIPDFAINGAVYFGRRMTAPTGAYDEVINITYSQDSSATEYRVLKNDEIGALPEVYDPEQKYLELLASFPLTDAVKKWTAPYSGVITVSEGTAGVSLIKPNDTVDGVRVSIQHNSGPEFSSTPAATILWSQTIAKDDTNNYFSGSACQNITVSCGDRIYFRVQSVFDGTNDEVRWEPEIEYTNIGGISAPATDPLNENSLSEWQYSAPDDFTTAGTHAPAVYFPLKGTVRLSGNISVSGALTDDARLVMTIENPIPNSGGSYTAPVELNVSVEENLKIIKANSTGTVLKMNGSNDYIQFDVQAGSRMRLALHTDSNIDIKKITWAPYIEYINAFDSKNIQIPVDKRPKGNVPSDVMFYPLNRNCELNAPQSLSSPCLNPNPEPAVNSGNFLEYRVMGRYSLSSALSQDITINLIVDSNTYQAAVIPSGGGVECTELSSLPVTVPSGGATCIKVQMIANDQSDLDKIEWQPRVMYYESDGSGGLWDKGQAIDSPTPYEIKLLSPSVEWRLRNMRLMPNFSVNSPGTGVNEDIVFTIKEKNKLLYKNTIRIRDGQILDNLPFTGELNLEAGHEIFMHCTSANPGLMSVITTAPIAVPAVSAGSYPDTIVYYTAAETGVFSSPYRGWSSAGLYANPAGMNINNLSSSSDPINELDFSTASLPDSTAVQNITSVEQVMDLYETLTSQKYLKFSPAAGSFSGINSVTEAWMGNPEVYCAMKDTDSDGIADIHVMSPSRESGMDDIQQDTETKLTRETTDIDVYGAYCISKLGRSAQKIKPEQFSVFSIFSSSSYSVKTDLQDSFSKTETDYLDMNGDGFPDIVSNQRGVQFTGPFGGLLGGYNTSLSSYCTNLSGYYWGYGTSTGLGFSVSVGDALSNIGVGMKKNGGTGGGTAMSSPQLCFSQGGSYGDDHNYNKIRIADINGDGLPDRLVGENKKILVYYNNGYGFESAPEEWVNRFTYMNKSNNDSSGTNESFGLSFIIGGYSNTSRSWAESNAENALVDVNGDGLPDIMTRYGHVFYNTGSGFSDAQIIYTSAGNAGKSKSRTGAEGSGTSIGGSIIIISGSGSKGKTYSINNSKQLSMFTDLDGDGYADIIRADGEGTFELVKNNTGRTNLLKKVTGPLKAEYEFEYGMNANSHDMPRPKWNLTRVDIRDGMDTGGVDRDNDGNGLPGWDDQRIDYSYEGGKYDKYEREFYGYSKVTEEKVVQKSQMGHAEQKLVTCIEFENSQFTLKGLATKQSVFTPGVMGGGNFTWAFSEYEYLTQDIIDTGHGKSVFPKLDSETETKKGTADMTVTKTYLYDSFGNVNEYTQSDGDVTKDLAAFVGYTTAGYLFTDSGIPDNIRVDRVGTAIVNNGSTKLMDHFYQYDSRGNLVNLMITEHPYSKMVYDYDYDSLGNMTQVIMPQNINSQRYTIDTQYNDESKSRVTRVEDSFGYYSENDYHPYGMLKESIDTNGYKLSYLYDSAARLTWVGMKDSSDNPIKGSVSYAYDTAASIPYARTSVNVLEPSPHTIETIVFTDGLGREIQVKRDAEIKSAGGGTEAVMVVSGRSILTPAGLVERQYYPVTESKESIGTGNTTYNTAIDSVAPVWSRYDPLGRPVYVMSPDSKMTSYVYDIAYEPGTSDIRQFTGVTDPKNNGKESYTDAFGRITRVIEKDNENSNNITTRYQYNALGDITDVYDANNNHTEIIYDFFRRRTSIDNPDTGPITFAYDTASNLLSKTGPTGVVNYEYDFNRLKKTLYPSDPVNDVEYIYGSAGERGPAHNNTAGRIKRVQYGSTGSNGIGYQETGYDEMGNAVLKVDSITVPGTSLAQTFTTRYSWDLLGRMTQITYPDGEAVSYGYDKGGLVKTVTGVKGAVNTDYVSSLLYDKFGQRVEINTGNGLKHIYGYYPDTRRLGRLNIYSGPDSIQELNYAYDAVGNISAVTNLMDKTIMPSGIPLKVERTFAYDGHYRLTGATGEIHDLSQTAGAPPVVETNAISKYDFEQNGMDSLGTHDLTAAGNVIYDTAPMCMYGDYAYRPGTGYFVIPPSLVADMAGRSKWTIEWYAWSGSISDQNLMESTDGSFSMVHEWDLQRPDPTLTRIKLPNNSEHTIQLTSDAQNQWARFMLVYDSTAVTGPKLKLYCKQTSIGIGDSNIMDEINTADPGAGIKISSSGDSRFDRMIVYDIALSSTEYPAEAENMQRNYSLVMEYSDIHNITRKRQVVQVQNGAALYTMPQYSYDNTYTYAAPGGQPHAVSAIEDTTLVPKLNTFTYDAAGNVDVFKIDLIRDLDWTPENRLKKVTEQIPAAVPPVTEEYWYDSAGQRKIRVMTNRGNWVDNDVHMYVNQYTSASIGSGNTVDKMTKNIYVGNQRIASDLVVDPNTTPQSFKYYYGNDHLGSTTYLTDDSGNIKEHVEYTPWGDSWFEYSNMDVYHQMNIPFRFTGKELERTQLYYYGARYYSPAASVWMSTDAAIVDYIDGMHFSGIYKSQNINLYGYSYQSPIVFKDPDGNVAQYGNQIDFVTDEQILLAKAIKEESVLGYLEHATKLILANFAQVVVDSTTNLADRLSSGAIGLIKDPHDEGAKEKLLGASAELLLSSVAAKTFTAANANRKLLKKPISDMPKEAKINFGFGKATAEQADKIGKSYVGKDSRPMSSGKGTISNDKTRAYRAPEYKRRIGKTQANIEYNTNPGGTDNKTFNGHIDIVEDK